MSNKDEVRELCHKLHAARRQEALKYRPLQSILSQILSMVRNCLNEELDDPPKTKKAATKLAQSLMDAIRGDGDPPDGVPASLMKEFAPVVRNMDRAVMPIESSHRRWVKEIEQAAKQLPVWKEWGEKVYGLGVRSLGRIVGETGADDPNFDGVGIGRFKTVDAWIKYASHAVTKGRADQQCSHRFRSVIWVACDSLLKQNSYYHSVYEDYKIFKVQKLLDQGLRIGGPSKTVENWEAHPDLPTPEALSKKELKEARASDEWETTGHIHNMAHRRMRQVFLEDLYRRWTPHAYYHGNPDPRPGIDERYRKEEVEDEQNS